MVYTTHDENQGAAREFAILIYSQNKVLWYTITFIMGITVGLYLLSLPPTVTDPSPMVYHW
jgi:hypothetical protein